MGCGAIEGVGGDLASWPRADPMGDTDFGLGRGDGGIPRAHEVV